MRRIQAAPLALGFVTFLLLSSPHVSAQVAYTVTTTAQGLPAGLTTNLYVDGSPNGTLSSGQTRSFSFSSSGVTHTISVDFYAPTSSGSNGARYYDSNPSWSFSGSGNHTFTYSTQFYLTVQTAYGTASGQGWYNAGLTAQASLKSGEVDEGGGTRLLFVGWSMDASGTNLTSNAIKMDGPKNATATWKAQFLLTVQADPPSVSALNGAGWYDAGALAAFSAPPTVAANGDSRLRFSLWSGDYVGQSENGSVVMDRPKVVTAHFVAQYLLDVEYDPASIIASYNETRGGWYDANSYVQLGPAPSTITVSSVERLRFIGWVDDGHSNSNMSVTVYMDAPHKIVLSYLTQYFVDVESSYGSSSGSGWYDRGSNAQISVTGAGGWPISHVLAGWTLNPTGTLTKTDDSWSLIVDRPYVVQADWTVDYFPLIFLIGGSGVAIMAAAVGAVVLHRRRGKRGSGSKLVLGTKRMCANCGAKIPDGAPFCQKCGAPAEVQSATPSLPPLEEKVYDYIAKHEGVISLSKAAEELGLTVEQLKDVTDRLKREGRLA